MMGWKELKPHLPLLPLYRFNWLFWWPDHLFDTHQTLAHEIRSMSACRTRVNPIVNKAIHQTCRLDGSNPGRKAPDGNETASLTMTQWAARRGVTGQEARRRQTSNWEKATASKQQNPQNQHRETSANPAAAPNQRSRVRWDRRTRRESNKGGDGEVAFKPHTSELVVPAPLPLRVTSDTSANQHHSHTNILSAMKWIRKQIKVEPTTTPEIFGDFTRQEGRRWHVKAAGKERRKSGNIFFLVRMLACSGLKSLQNHYLARSMVRWRQQL